MSTTNYERQIIAEEYKQKFSKTIFEEINAKISNKDTKNIVTLMFYNYYELDARTIHKALKEGKRNEKPIIEIFASRPSWFLQIVNDEYKRIYGITLKEELAQEKKSDFITFLQCILVTPRLKTNFIKNEKQAGDVVQDIISKGLKKYGTDVELFKNLFVKNSRDDLIYICREFKVMDKKKRNLYDAVDDTVPKTTKELIKAIIYAVVLPSHYFAHLLKKSIVGLGTDEETLNRVLVERQEIDMDFIRSYYKLETKRELVDDIKGDTSGVYQQITVKIASV
jgi:annexin A7/11